MAPDFLPAIRSAAACQPACVAAEQALTWLPTAQVWVPRPAIPRVPSYRPEVAVYDPTAGSRDLRASCFLIAHIFPVVGESIACGRISVLFVFRSFDEIGHVLTTGSRISIPTSRSANGDWHINRATSLPEFLQPSSRGRGFCSPTPLRPCFQVFLFSTMSDGIVAFPPVLLTVRRHRTIPAYVD